MRLSIVVLASVLVIGSVVVLLGFLTNQSPAVIPEIPNPYANLEQYKTELEKINNSNQEILETLQEQIKNSDDIHLEQIKQEIEVVKRVISENKAELEDVIRRLSEMKSEQ